MPPPREPSLQSPTPAAEQARSAYEKAGGDLSHPGLRAAFDSLANEARGLLPLALGDVTLLPDVLTSDLRQLPRPSARFIDEVERLGDGEEARRLLRRHRHRGVVRIALREVMGLADAGQTSAEMADLASECIEAGLRGARTWARQTHGLVRDAAGEEVPLVVLGMGKLGGRELNIGSTTKGTSSPAASRTRPWV